MRGKKILILFLLLLIGSVLVLRAERSRSLRQQQEAYTNAHVFVVRELHAQRGQAGFGARRRIRSAAAPVAADHPR